MRRRDFLRASTGLAVTASVAGCTGLIETQPYGIPPTVEDPPDEVYYPTHVEEMAMAGMQRSNGYACALAHTYPHRFWLVTGEETRKVDIESEDSLHLMPTIWHEETGTRLVDTSVSIAIERDGEEVADVRPWTMLSQPMGPHFGDNVSLPEKGTYVLTVEMRSPDPAPTGALADASESATFEFEFDFDPNERNELGITEFPDRQGQPGAIEPMEMKMIPSVQLPEPGDLPGELVGTAQSADVVFAAVALADAPRFGSEDPYLAVSARTPYNRYPIPLASLSATVSRDGSTAFEDTLTARLDPELGYHYGATVPDLTADDAVTVSVETPPQTARHEGYETAFFDVPDAELNG